MVTTDVQGSKKGTLLVTGGAGFIGSHFVELAIRSQYNVVVLDALTYAGHRENLEQIKDLLTSNTHYDFIHGSIADQQLVSGLLRNYHITGVVNFAAETHVDRSINGPGEFIETNIAGTFNLLRCALAYYESLPAEGREKFRYLQVSTDEVFGSLGPTGKFNEQTPFEPNSPYSASKAAADFLVHAWFHTYGFPSVTTHCSNNYGPRQYPEKLIPFMITSALTEKPLGVYGDGQNVRDWIHVEDHCAGIMLAFETGKTGRRYCFGGNEEWKNIDLVKLICKELDKLQPCPDGKKYESTITFVKDRAGHDQRYAIDDSLAQKELGFKRRYDFRTGLASTVEWYVRNQEWCKKVIRRK